MEMAAVSAALARRLRRFELHRVKRALNGHLRGSETVEVIVRQDLDVFVDLWTRNWEIVRDVV